MATIAVVTPAFAAQRWIGDAVRSVLAQTHRDWEHWLVADDGVDYEALLAEAGLRDRRQRFLATPRRQSGASAARNLALDQLTADHVAILDADDRLKPDKLARAALALEQAPIVSTALDVVDEAGRHLRLVGAGPDRLLAPGAYKFTSLSMDSMIVWDRRRCDARYDLTLTNMTDLELLLQLWQSADRVLHLGTPLHDYLKLSVSMSNGPGVTERMIRSKRILLGRLAENYYRFADSAATEGLAAFLDLSLAAEASFPEALAAQPGLLFENHLEPMLRAAGR